MCGNNIQLQVFRERERERERDRQTDRQTEMLGKLQLNRLAGILPLEVVTLQLSSTVKKKKNVDIFKAP